jgi:hypothetical protein
VSLNPALPLLALLGAAGLLWGLAAPADAERPLRRGLGIAWAALTLAVIALLAPALVLPTGIPSPAAALAGIPPWPAAPDRSPGDGNNGNPLLRDVTFQIQPWLLFLRHELRAGRLPFWNPHQFSGSPFWANGQSAPLFPPHLLFAVLPLQLGFVLLPWLRLVTGGCGTWVLARELGLSSPSALLAALIFPLSGMLVSFLLFPMGNALALVPWVLWSVERIAAGRGSWGALGGVAGLQLLAGHPETAAHTALLSALYLLVRGPARPAGAWLRFVAGWSVGAAVAAVQLLPLALTLFGSSRWRHLAEPGALPPVPVLLQQPLRLVLPQLYGHPAAGTWWGPFNYSATAVYAGALALPLAAAGLARCRGDRRWLAVAVLLIFSFAAAYHWPGVREALSALPVLGRALHHRLLFGVELGLALLAGAGCDRWLAGGGRGLLAGAAAAVLLLASAWGLYAGDWAARGLTGGQIAWTAGAAVVALLLALSLRLRRARRWAVWPLLPALALCDLCLAHGAINPGLPLARLYPETGAVRFLRGREGRVAGVGQALRPNAAMVYGLRDARGDDPVKLERYEAVYRTFASADPVYFQAVGDWSHPWLDRLGVRWVVAGPSEPAPRAGWRLAYRGEEARVYERPGALPLVRSSEGVEARVARSVPGLWEIDWRAPRAGLLVVAETWERGWSAESGGDAVEVLPVNGALLGVRLGPGEGRLRLRYRPPGIAAGAALSFAGLAALAGSRAVAARLKRREPEGAA